MTMTKKGPAAIQGRAAPPSAQDKDACRRAIESLLSAQLTIIGAVVSTADGMDVASLLRAPITPMSAAKLSAMTSSQLALAQATVREATMGKVRSIVIEATQGLVLTREIPSVKHSLLLTAMCSADVTLGQVLWAVRDCVSSLGKALDTH